MSPGFCPQTSRERCEASYCPCAKPTFSSPPNCAFWEAFTSWQMGRKSHPSSCRRPRRRPLRPVLKRRGHSQLHRIVCLHLPAGRGKANAAMSRAVAIDSDDERLPNLQNPTTFIKREMVSPNVEHSAERLNSKKRRRPESSAGSHRALDEDRSPISNSNHSFGVESRHTQLAVGYPCNLCSAFLNSGDELRAHIAALHVDAEVADQMVSEQSPEPLSCPLCHMQFVSKEWLQAHARVCMLQCSQCSETFHSQQEYADHHLNTHNKLMLVCKQCNSIFKSRDGLNCHMNTAHNRNRIYPCGICAEGFYTRQAAYVHRRKMHPGQQTSGQVVAKVLNATSSSMPENNT